MAGTDPSQKLSSGKKRLIGHQTELAGSQRHWNEHLLCCGQGQTNVVKNYSHSSHPGLFQNIQALIRLITPQTPYAGNVRSMMGYPVTKDACGVTGYPVTEHALSMTSNSEA